MAEPSQAYASAGEGDAKETKAEKVDFSQLKTVVMQENGTSPRTLIELPPGVTADQVREALISATQQYHRGPHGGQRWTAEAHGLLDDTDSTHLWIVHQAIRVMGELDSNDAKNISAWFKNGSRTNDATRPWPDNTIFHDAFCKGLWDADHVNPWMASECWQSHFYSTVTKQSYNSIFVTTDGSDVVNAWQYATRALRYMIQLYQLIQNEPDNHKHVQYYVEFFYYAGVYTHYFTDQTQPMHAHNYANAVAGANDKFHSAYENAAQVYINSKPPALVVTKDSLTQENCWNFGGDVWGFDTFVQDWLQAASLLGWNNYREALVDNSQTRWSLAPGTDEGRDPVPNGNTIDRVYLIPQLFRPPQGYSSWQDMCKPCWNTTLTGAVRATVGLLTRMFGHLGVFKEVMYPKGNAHKPADFPQVRQVPAQLTCQTFWLEGVGACNIYNNSSDGNAKEVTGTFDSTFTIGGEYCVTVCVDNGASPIRTRGIFQVCEPGRSSRPNFKRPGGEGAVIAPYICQGASFPSLASVKALQ